MTKTTTAPLTPTAIKDYARLRTNAAFYSDDLVLDVIRRALRSTRPGAAQRRCLEVYLDEAARRGLTCSMHAELDARSPRCSGLTTATRTLAGEVHAVCDRHDFGGGFLFREGANR